MTLNDGFMNKMLECLAWSEISRDFTFDEQLLAKFQENVDWPNISANSYIRWASTMLEEFKNRIDWDILSSSYPCRREYCVFSISNLEKYKEYWNWTNLSKNRYIEFSIEKIERLAQEWDWDILIDNSEFKEMLDIDILFKYKQYISAPKFWDSLVGLKTKQIIEEKLTYKSNE